MVEDHHNSLDKCLSHLGCDPFPRTLHHTELSHETEGCPHQCCRQMGQGRFLNHDIMEPGFSCRDGSGVMRYGLVKRKYGGLFWFEGYDGIVGNENRGFAI